MDRVAGRLLFSLSIVSGVALASSHQQPLLSHEVEVNESRSSWNFNFSSSAPHYFASAYGLLQQWPNTFFPNGYSIAPCEVAAFTKLYHGRTDDEVPPSPECGMSYGITGGTRNSHMLTYQTTRAVKCIYFDGESAALMGTGQLDTQMLHIYGNISGPDDQMEVSEDSGTSMHVRMDYVIGLRRKSLVGVDGEWKASHLNITAPLLPPSEDGEEGELVEGKGEEESLPTSYYPLPPLPTKTDRATDPSNPPVPPNWRRDWGREPFSRTLTSNWFMAGASHYGSSGYGPGMGETRVKILGCGFMNYYSPKFMSTAISRAAEEQKNLNLTKEGFWAGPGSNGTRSQGLAALTRRRRAHTLTNTSLEDATIIREDSERVLLHLLSNSENCSGMDWTVLTNEIVQTYATDLASFLKVLQTFDGPTKKNASEVRDWAARVRDRTHSFLLPFLEYPNKTSEESWMVNSTLFKDTYLRCRFHYTRLLDPLEGVFIGPEESTLKWATEEVMSGICSVLVDVGLSMERVWYSNFNAPSHTAPPRSMLGVLREEINRWIEGVEELMAWLGWAGEWVSCEEKCAWDEKCFIPMWPLIRMGFGRGPRPPPGGKRPEHGGPDHGGPGGRF
ncbi:hypothetical protein B7463_g6684, partial [Scytalidium lignicola]